MPHRNGTKAPALSPEELSQALNVKPPSDPQALEDHVHQLLMRAQVSWLSKRDVLDILSNWEAYNLPISLMPPDQPGPGSLFLFDRTTLKSFRRDNHVWKSKAGGKTVQETHEKLKIDGGIPALNCYYAHSADGTLQRRCYWKLADTPNIVLMHYRAPGLGKRAGVSSPPTAATPLTVQARLPAAPAFAASEANSGAGPADGAAAVMPHLPGMHADGEAKHEAVADGVPPGMPGPQDLAAMASPPGGNGLAHPAAWHAAVPPGQQGWYPSGDQLVPSAQWPADRGPERAFSNEAAVPSLPQVPPPEAPVPFPSDALPPPPDGGEPSTSMHPGMHASEEKVDARPGELAIAHGMAAAKQETDVGLVPPPPSHQDDGVQDCCGALKRDPEDEAQPFSEGVSYDKRQRLEDRQVPV